jgi:hypothetical protein
MTLREHILAIQDGIRSGRFVNEAAVSQGIVLRLLQALSWPTYDTQVVSPEYTIEGRRVDFALCHPRNKPTVFIEVKQLGQSEGADRQLFEYAFHVGVPMAILTDGQEWHFFLPGEQGQYQERRVYKLDILERDVEESAERLKRYLTYEAVCSGEAIESAREDYRNVSRKRQIRKNIPVAWMKLIEEKDDLLVELLADKVESLCGYKPDPDLVASFLAEKVPVRTGVAISPTTDHMRRLDTTSRGPRTHRLESRGFMLHGDRHDARNAIDVLIKLFEELSERDSTFLERFATLPKHGKKRRYLAMRREDLYPGRLDLARECSHRLSSGWWLGTNYSKRTIERIIRMACDVAGVRFGSELQINLD